MNLILFHPHETDRPLPCSDPRAVHVLQVLRREPGDSFDVGLVDGPRGKAQLIKVSPEALEFEFTWGAIPPPASPISLLIGLPRPQTARKILQEATSLGVRALHFVATDRGEPSYAQSTLWTTGEWHRHLVAGAEQAFDTRLPEVTYGPRLDEALQGSPSGSSWALDNYESPFPLSEAPLATPLVLAFGGERGWSTRERDLLRSSGFRLAHLGPRVLRTETAVVAALAVAKARLGLL